MENEGSVFTMIKNVILALQILVLICILFTSCYEPMASIHNLKKQSNGIRVTTMTGYHGYTIDEVWIVQCDNKYDLINRFRSNYDLSSNELRDILASNTGNVAVVQTRSSSMQTSSSTQVYELDFEMKKLDGQSVYVIGIRAGSVSDIVDINHLLSE
jgi:hypothetical protein